MRTLLEVIRGKPVGERQYCVEGDIVFEFTPAQFRECPEGKAAELQAAIRRADEAFPWRDKSDHDGSDLPSIQYLGGAQNQYHNLSRPELHVWFRIIPSATYVRKGQVHSYEKYLEKLAEELAKQEMGAVSVRSVFRAGSVKFFRR